MTNSMNVEDLLSGTTNVIEIYLCEYDIKGLDDKHSVNVGWSKEIRLTNTLGMGNTQRLCEYVQRDLSYIYDLENDGQRVVTRIYTGDHSDKFWYAVMFQEDTLPSHRFPCTSEITHETIIHRTSYRFSNRVHIVHDYEEKTKHHYYYIRYQHSEQADLSKIQQDIDKAMAIVKRSR